MTIPDQTMSMTEILQRHRQGLPTMGARTTFYEEEGTEGMTQQEFQKLDLADQEQIIKQRKYQLEEIKANTSRKVTELRDQQAAALAKKTEEARQAAAEKLRLQEKPTPGTE